MRLPGHCVGGGSHYRLTVRVTNRDTGRLHSRELWWTVSGQWDMCTKHTLNYSFYLLNINYLCVGLTVALCSCVHVRG